MVAEEPLGGLVLSWGDQRPHQVIGEGDHDDQKEQHLGLGEKDPQGQACPEKKLAWPLVPRIHSHSHSLTPL